jgi:hypothetical protein
MGLASFEQLTTQYVIFWHRVSGAADQTDYEDMIVNLSNSGLALTGISRLNYGMNRDYAT